MNILYDPQGIVAVLEKYTAKSLVMLSLSSERPRSMGGILYFDVASTAFQEQCLGSLELFTALKFVRGDDSLFGSAINCLGDVLPKTVEVSIFVTNPRNPPLPGIFRSFAQLERGRFPNFKRLVIETDSRIDTTLTDFLNACLSLSSKAHSWGHSGRHYTEFYTSGEGNFRIPDWPETWPKCRADLRDSQNRL